MQLFDFQILTDISDVSFKVDSLFAFVRWRSSRIYHDPTTKDIHSIINILLTQLKLLIADSSKAVFLLNSSTIIVNYNYNSHLQCASYKQTEGALRSSYKVSVAGPTTWNSLPTFLRDTTLTLKQFQNRLKTHLFSIAYVTR